MDALCIYTSVKTEVKSIHQNAWKSVEAYRYVAATVWLFSFSHILWFSPQIVVFLCRSHIYIEHLRLRWISLIEYWTYWKWTFVASALHAVQTPINTMHWKSRQKLWIEKKITHVSQFCSIVTMDTLGRLFSSQYLFRGRRSRHIFSGQINIVNRNKNENYKNKFYTHTFGICGNK